MGYDTGLCCVNYSEIIFEKLDNFLATIEDNDFHNIICNMVTNALTGRIIRYKLNAEKIDAYFNYSPETWDEIKNYNPNKLMKFLDRIMAFYAT